MLVLSVTKGPDEGQSFRLSEDRAHVIGRHHGSVPLDDQRVSRRHAQITRDNGQFAITDLGSSNGTYLNNQPVTEPAALADGDVLQIGKTTFEVSLVYDVTATVTDVGDDDDDASAMIVDSAAGTAQLDASIRDAIDELRAELAELRHAMTERDQREEEATPQPPAPVTDPAVIEALGAIREQLARLTRAESRDTEANDDEQPGDAPLAVTTPPPWADKLDGIAQRLADLPASLPAAPQSDPEAEAAAAAERQQRDEHVDQRLDAIADRLAELNPAELDQIIAALAPKLPADPAPRLEAIDKRLATVAKVVSNTALLIEIRDAVAALPHAQIIATLESLRETAQRRAAEVDALGETLLAATKATRQQVAKVVREAIDQQNKLNVKRHQQAVDALDAIIAAIPADRADELLAAVSAVREGLPPDRSDELLSAIAALREALPADRGDELAAKLDGLAQAVAAVPTRDTQHAIDALRESLTADLAAARNTLLTAVGDKHDHLVAEKLDAVLAAIANLPSDRTRQQVESLRNETKQKLDTLLLAARDRGDDVVGPKLDRLLEAARLTTAKLDDELAAKLDALQQALPPDRADELAEHIHTLRDALPADRTDELHAAIDALRESLPHDRSDELIERLDALRDAAAPDRTDELHAAINALRESLPHDRSDELIERLDALRGAAPPDRTDELHTAINALRDALPADAAEPLAALTDTVERLRLAVEQAPTIDDDTAAKLDLIVETLGSMQSAPPRDADEHADPHDAPDLSAARFNDQLDALRDAVDSSSNRQAEMLGAHLELLREAIDPAALRDKLDAIAEAVAGREDLSLLHDKLDALIVMTDQHASSQPQTGTDEQDAVSALLLARIDALAEAVAADRDAATGEPAEPRDTTALEHKIESLAEAVRNHTGVDLAEKLDHLAASIAFERDSAVDAKLDRLLEVVEAATAESSIESELNTILAAIEQVRPEPAPSIDDDAGATAEHIAALGNQLDQIAQRLPSTFLLNELVHRLENILERQETDPTAVGSPQRTQQLLTEVLETVRAAHRSPDQSLLQQILDEVRGLEAQPAHELLHEISQRIHHLAAAAEGGPNADAIRDAVADALAAQPALDPRQLAQHLADVSGSGPGGQTEQALAEMFALLRRIQQTQDDQGARLRRLADQVERLAAPESANTARRRTPTPQPKPAPARSNGASSDSDASPPTSPAIHEATRSTSPT